MNYSILTNEYSTNHISDKKKQKWPYISNKKMEELYPNGGYMIVADLKDGKKEDCVGYLTDEDQQVELFPYQHQLKSNERCVGFICVSSQDERDCFVRIVKKSKKGLLLPLLLLSLAVSLIGGFLLMNGSGEKPNLDESAISYHIEGMENKDPSNISIPIFTQVKVDQNTMEAELHLANPDGNPCYFQYSIVLDEGNKEVYRSKLIEPATAVPKFKLNTNLKKGSYPAMIKIDTFALNDHTTEMNGGEMNIELIIE